VFEGTIPRNGTAATTMFPPNVAVLIKKRTALGGRRGRGRMYFPWFLGEGDADERGSISAAVQANLSAACENFRLAIAAASGAVPGTPMVLLHSTAPLGPAVAPTPVIALVVDPLVATQRRRLGR
jgi:hypothetical protein